MLVAAEQRSGCAVTEIAGSELAKLAFGRDGGGTGREFHTGRFCCQSHCGLAGKDASYGNGFLDLFQAGPFLLSLGFCGFGVARKKDPISCSSQYQLGTSQNATITCPAWRYRLPGLRFRDGSGQNSFSGAVRG